MRNFKGFYTMLALVAYLLLSGCASLNTQTQNPPSSPPTVSSSSTSSSIPGSHPTTPLAAPAPVFYDFKDVPVPPEFTLIQKESNVLQTSTFKSGVLVFKGKINYNSVADFYLSAMQKENWTLKASSRYSHCIMVFEKPSKICVINIYPKAWYCYLKIYVLPIRTP